MKKILYKNRFFVLGLSILMILCGAFLSYINYGIEPQETIGGFLCGLGFGMLLIYFSIKN